MNSVSAILPGKRIAPSGNCAPAAARAASVSEFSGLAPASPLDQTSTATGYSDLPTSGPAATTAASELLIGAIGVTGFELLKVIRRRAA